MAVDKPAKMERLGDYEIKKELGRGATACAYLGQHSQTDAQVCLKVFHPTLWQEGRGERRIQREIDLTKTLKHPNIVRVRDVLETDPPALVMDYVEGQNLEKFQSTLPYVFPEVSVCIAIEILKALEYAHKKGVIHRDIKPENILVDKLGQVYVTDFGHAKVRDATMGTQPNALMGSLDYMSPEQARGDQTGPTSDLFSVGILLYFLTTGTRPFTRAGAAATLIAIREEDPEAPSRRNPKISAELTRILLKALAKDPADRFESAKDFRTTLEGYLKRLNLHELSLGYWQADPSKETIDGLSLATESLITACERALKDGDRARFLELMAHLNLKAPESPAISRLTKLFESEKVQKRRKAVFWIFGGLGTAAAAALAVFLYLPKPEAPKKVETPPPVIADKPAEPKAVLTKAISQPVAKPPKKVVPKKRPPAPKKKVAKKKQKTAPPKPQLGTVRFEVANDITVFWNGVEVDTSQPLKGQKIGTHDLKLVRPGYDPISSKVVVKIDQPTVIRVR